MEEHPDSYVFRTAGSHGPADLIQVFHHGKDIQLFQLKITHEPADLRAVERLRRKTGLCWYLAIPAKPGTGRVYQLVDTYKSLDKEK